MRTVGLQRAIALALVAGIATLGLTACSPKTGPEPEKTTEQTTTAPEPTFDPNGGAEANKAYFDKTLEAMLAENSKADSHTFVNTLANAGFDKSQMEVTFDKTTIGLDADYIIVSVKMPDNQCLIGQRSARGYASMVAQPVSTGKCLIGKTQQIDW